MTDPNQMTPEDALKHLDGVASKYHGTREDHALLSFSTRLLQQVLANWRQLQKEAQERMSAPKVSDSSSEVAVASLPEKTELSDVVEKAAAKPKKKNKGKRVASKK